VNVSIDIDQTEWRNAMRRMVAQSSRSLAAVINARMFYVLLRAYVLMKPQNVQAERNKVREYMSRVIRRAVHAKGTHKGRVKDQRGKRTNPHFTVAHAIAQKKAFATTGKGLYGDSMREAAKSTRQRATGSVGYLKAVIAKGIARINGHFTQFGGALRTRRGVKTRTQANAALVTIAQEYGVYPIAGNVKMFKNQFVTFYRAEARVNPTEMITGRMGVKDGQESTVMTIYKDVFGRAMNDELREMKAHLGEVVADEANKVGIKATSTYG
jgi:hypothetical protein